MGAWVVLSTYIVGFFMSLIFLAKFWKKIGLPDYDPPHEPYYDDYKTNEEAWMAFSIGWPIFYLMFSIEKIYVLMLSVYRKMVKKINK